MKNRIATYAEFWPHYLRAHSRSHTRTWHYIGTAIAIALLVVMVASSKWWLFPLAILSGYASSWVGHIFVEHNRPATFTHAFWSLISDLRMFGYWMSGKLGRELERAGIPSRGSPPAGEPKPMEDEKQSSPSSD